MIRLIKSFWRKIMTEQPKVESVYQIGLTKQEILAVLTLMAPAKITVSEVEAVMKLKEKFMVHIREK